MNRKAYRNQTVTASRAEVAAIRANAPFRFTYKGKLRFLASLRATPAFLAGQAEIEARHKALDGIGGSAARGASRMAPRGQAGDTFYTLGSAELPVSYAAQGERETSADRPDTGAE
jgi:hypothetical protein